MIAARAPSIELRETIREIASRRPKTATAPRPTGQDIASRTPSPVAADLPPVKFSQIDRLCPRRTASPAAQTVQGAQVCRSSALGGAAEANEVNQGQNQRTKAPAAAPFSTSRS